MTVRSKPAPAPGQGPSAAVPEDALKAMLQTLVQQTLDAEFRRFMRAAPHERHPARTG